MGIHMPFLMVTFYADMQSTVNQLLLHTSGSLLTHLCTCVSACVHTHTHTASWSTVDSEWLTQLQPLVVLS